MEYLLLFFGFLATAIGVRGNTWNQNKVGWRRLTITGWFAISIAFIAASISAYLYFLSQEKAHFNKQLALFTFVSDFKSFERMALYTDRFYTLPEGEKDGFLEKLDKIYNSTFEDYKVHVLLYSQSLNPTEKMNIEFVLSSAQRLRDYNPEFKRGVTISLKRFTDNVGQIRQQMCKSINVREWSSEACDKVSLQLP